MNYKKIPYTTEWMDLADIKPKLESYGVEPKAAETAGAAVGVQYTLPVIQLPDKTFISDSANIVVALESRYPESTLHLGKVSYEEAQGLVFKCALPLFPEYMPCIRNTLITEHSKPYWTRSRETLFGMTIDDFQRTKGGESAWQAAEPGFQALMKFLTEHKLDNGPFILGSQPSYADFILVAFLESSRRTSKEIFNRIVDFDPSIKELYNASRKWLERSSH